MTRKAAAGAHTAGGPPELTHHPGNSALAEAVPGRCTGQQQEAGAPLSSEVVGALTGPPSEQRKVGQQWSGMVQRHVMVRGQLALVRHIGITH